MDFILVGGALDFGDSTIFNIHKLVQLSSKAGFRIDSLIFTFTFPSEELLVEIACLFCFHCTAMGYAFHRPEAPKQGQRTGHQRFIVCSDGSMGLKGVGLIQIIGKEIVEKGPGTLITGKGLGKHRKVSTVLYSETQRLFYHWKIF